MHITLVNLLGVAVVAFFVPFALGFFPRGRVPSVTLELVDGILIGPAVLGWVEPGPVVSVLATIGVAFLLFLAGLELDLHVLRGAPLVRGAPSFVLSFGRLREINGSALILAGLLSAVVLPAAATALLGGARERGRADALAKADLRDSV
jgi:Kef-type K+ transport system membrane component KefB